ncbi:hypothetical protein NMY22_g1478 [Coprinellus aureogranulatus]|nr:hypothetical protein NMY22_g1478 [Coprinellus aureogranulatus]
MEKRQTGASGNRDLDHDGGGSSVCFDSSTCCSELPLSRNASGLFLTVALRVRAHPIASLTKKVPRTAIDLKRTGSLPQPSI